MKFHRLTIRNLTTITGEQTVDFDALFNEGSPLLIHGPTGAGKTTILDAITLALYDETARISDEAQEKKNQLELNGLKVNDPRQIVSRGATEASSELIFSTVVRGRRRYFRAGWQVERVAVRKGNPEKWGGTRRRLIELNADFSDKRDGLRVDSNKFKEYNPCFQEALAGLESVQFRRSVLLAQGQFAALLTADASHRADMLEGLTGTKEFGQIGLRAHEAYGAAKKAVEKINLEIKGASLWSDEAFAENRRQQAEKEAEQVRLEAEEMLAKQGEVWWVELQTLQQAAQKADTAAEAARAEHGALQPLRDWAARYQATASLIRHHEEQARAAQDAEQKRSAASLLDPKITEIRAALEEATVAEQPIAEAAKRARAENEAVLAALPEVQALHAEAASVTQSREAAGKRHAQAVVASNGAASKLTAAGKAVDAQRSKLENAKRQSAGFEAWRGHEAEVAALQQATTDFKLASSHLPRVLQRQNALELEEALNKRVEALEAARVAVSELTAECSKLVALEEAAGERHREAVQSVSDAEKHLELLSKLASIEQHRDLLKPGEACMLCGSTEHPLAAAPVSQRVQEIAEARAVCAARIAVRDARLEELTKVRAERNAVSGGLVQREAHLQEAARQRDEAALLLGRRAAELQLPVEGLREALLREREAAEATLVASEQALLLAAAWLPLPALRTAEVDCDARMQAVYDHISRAAAAAAAVVAQASLLESEAKATEQCRAAAEEAAREVVVAEAEVASLTEALTVAKSRVMERWSGRTPDEVVKAANDALSAADRRLKEHAERLAQLQVDLTRETTQQRELLRSADELSAAGEASRAIRDAGLLAAGSHLDRFLGDLRAPAEVASATERLATVEEKVRAAESGRVAAHAAVAAQTDLAVPGGFASLVAAADEVERLRGLIKQAIGELSRLRGAHEEAQRHAALQAGRKASLAAAEELQGRWKLIYDLIGSGEGKAFRKAAQALNLERLLRAANIWLRELDDRYAFRQSFHGDGSPSLDFHLIDAYHADAPCGINLISGGESFLCSLALALGLASERGDTLSIETLLLDEGFGTLDSASLEVAIQTLEKLQQRHTAVGIISHVEGLRTRIETQLEVRPVAPGRSVIAQSRCP